MNEIPLKRFNATVYSTIGEVIEKKSGWLLETNEREFFVTAESGQKKLRGVSMRIISVILREGVFPPSRKILDSSRNHTSYYVESESNFLFVHLGR